MHTTVRMILWVAALATVLGAAGCGGNGEGSTGNGRSGGDPDTALLAGADVALASRADLSVGVPVSGTLTPGWEGHVTSPLDDIVESVAVREGQRVSRSQVLARFRQSSVATAAASARAQLKSASADFERQKNLLREGAVSERDVEGAEAGFRAAQAQDADASRRFQDATVRAPAAGMVTKRSVQSGDRVATGDPMFVVADTRTLEFEATVPSEYVPMIRPGAPVVLSVSGFPAGSIRGKVARLNSTADEATRQVKVYVAVPNPGGQLVGNLFASGDIVTEHAARVLAVPSAALRKDARGTLAYVIENGHVALRPIRPGVRDEAQDLVQILDGLHEGDRVIVGPVEGLVAGQPVRVAGRER
jgi:membrane fusion protein (multidrug efflux system)